MQTFILARTPEESHAYLHQDIQLSLAVDVCQVADILFRRAEYFTESLMGIPAVALWVGHEIAFYNYADSLYETLMFSPDKIPAGAPGRIMANLSQAVNDMRGEIWGSDYDPNAPRVYYQMTNPMLTVSGEIIQTHWIDLVRTHPSYMVPYFNQYLDLSIDPIYAWDKESA
jgi:hypothetical protein